jgi:hypothetical protein
VLVLVVAGTSNATEARLVRNMQLAAAAPGIVAEWAVATYGGFADASFLAARREA